MESITTMTFSRHHVNNSLTFGPLGTASGDQAVHVPGNLQRGSKCVHTHTRMYTHFRCGKEKSKSSKKHRHCNRKSEKAQQ